METVRIARAASAHPELRVSQQEAAAYLADNGASARRVTAVARGTRIESRYSLLSATELRDLGGIEARNNRYRNAAASLALAAAGKVLEPDAVPRTNLLATSSCTGYGLPGLSARVSLGLGLRDDVRRVPITEAGCAGGVVALTVAMDHLRARPGVGLAVAAELCSLAYHPDDGDDGRLVSNLIFGDGAGAALLEAGPGPGIEVLDSESALVAGTADVLGFELTDAGFSPILDRCLPEIVPRALARATCNLLARHDLDPADIAAWLLHPGGARILEGIEETFGVSRARTRWSWDSMRESGNTSSAAIFDVLARYLDAPGRGGGHVIIAAFGPGLSVELLLGKQEC